MATCVVARLTACDVEENSATVALPLLYTVGRCIHAVSGDEIMPLIQQRRADEKPLAQDFGIGIDGGTGRQIGPELFLSFPFLILDEKIIRQEHTCLSVCRVVDRVFMFRVIDIMDEHNMIPGPQ